MIIIKLIETGLIKVGDFILYLYCYNMFFLLLSFIFDYISTSFLKFIKLRFENLRPKLIFKGFVI